MRKKLCSISMCPVVCCGPVSSCELVLDVGPDVLDMGCGSGTEKTHNHFATFY
jgi:hypothetical protein